MREGAHNAVRGKHMRFRVCARLTTFLVGSILAPLAPALADGGQADSSQPSTVPTFPYAGTQIAQNAPYSAGASAPYQAPPPAPYPYPQYAQASPNPGPYPQPTQTPVQNPADPNAGLRNLEQRISEQERRVTELERELKDQAARLDFQKRERQAQMRLIIEQQEALERQNQELRNLRAQYQYAQWYALYGRQMPQTGSNVIAAQAPGPAPSSWPPATASWAVAWGAQQAQPAQPGVLLAQAPDPTPNSWPPPPASWAVAWDAQQAQPAQTGVLLAQDVQPVEPAPLPGEEQPVPPQPLPEGQTQAAPEGPATPPEQGPVAPVELPGAQGPVTPEQPAATPGAQPQATPEGQAQPAPGEKGAKGTETKAGEEERPQSEKPMELLLLEAGGILLPSGRLVLEPAMDYEHVSGNKINISGFTIFDAIVIGTIRVDSLQRDIVTPQLTARYGVFDRVQVDANVPYVYRRDTTIRGVGTNNVTEQTITGTAIGDVTGTVEWQPIVGHGSLPDTILRMSVRAPTGTSAFEIPTVTVGAGGETQLTEAPTGTGFWGAGPGVTAVWRTDPVVLFAGGAYTFNFSRTFPTFGKIDPGDTFQYFGGLNFAVNEAVSLNMSFVDQITDSTTQNGVLSPGTSANDARLILGTSVGVSKYLSLLISAGAGLTDQSPDFTLTVSAPITLDIFR